MKYSKYNLMIKNDDSHFLFNTLSGHCFRVSPDVVQKISENDIAQIDKSTFELFTKYGVIIDDEIDESKYISYQHNKAKFSNSTVSATVLLTWGCNLACVYCYEGAGAKVESMNETTAKNFVLFMVNQVKNRNARYMSVNLFGGEPLINIECGIMILKELKEFCDNNNVIFASSIITNGTLLTDTILKQLINLNCKNFQITLDGMPATHNARRPYKNGNGSFDQIMNNLEMLNKHNAKTHTVIRINVDKKNIKEIGVLLEYLGINGRNLTNCTVDFGIIRSATQACAAYSDHCLSEDIIGDVLDTLWQKAEKEGFHIYTRPFPKWIFCGLYSDSQFTVTPNGELYKCWEHAGEKEHLMGQIDEKGNITDITYAYIDWMSHDPLNIEECCDCIYLPACGGGCGAISFNVSGTYHSKGCFKVKGVLEKQIIRYILGKNDMA